MNNQEKKDSWFIKLLRKRWGEALIYLLGSILASVVLGGIFYLIDTSIPSGFWGPVRVVFYWFFAPLVVMAALRLLTNIDPNGQWIMYISCGLYYGTIVVAILLKDIGLRGSDGARYFVGFVISALICYIVYSNKHKSKK